MIATAGGYKASQLVRDAEMLGILRHARAIVGCPACASDVRLDLRTGRIHCHRCHTTTDLRAYADGRADALMRTDTLPPLGDGESDEEAER